jgi:hypothetical protein
MDVTEITQIVPPPPEPKAPDPPAAPNQPAAAAALAAFSQCEECGAPVDHDQRYCVSCGAHRRHVTDPAARYLSAATARARSSARVASSPAAARPRRSSGLAAAVLIAVIPVAVAVGVAVGRSSNNDDANLIKELSRSQAQVAAASRATATTPAATNATAAPATGSAPKKHHVRSSTKGKTRHRATSSTNASKAPSNLNGHASATQKKQGQAIVNRLQHTNGTSYLNQLPSQVVVP